MNRSNTLARRTVLAHSPHLAVESHRVQLPSGQIVPDWPWVVTPAYVTVLPVTRDGTYLCVRQQPYGERQESLAPIDGLLEPGDQPIHAAQRVLMNALGYLADHWHLLGDYQTDAMRGMGNGALFLAADAYFVGTTRTDTHAARPVVRFGRDELQTALLAGAFTILPWATTVALALLRGADVPPAADPAVHIGRTR